MAKLYPFYHSSQDIHDKLSDLSTRCPNMKFETIEGSSPTGDTRSIDVVTVKDASASPRNKNFFLFGEHARELISPESGLHLVQSLCGENGLQDRAAEVLKDNEFKIVVNGNPASRSKVEQGDFCLRVNPNGVDLNRNWDEKWEASGPIDPQDTNPGPQPFSEPETRVFKDLVSDYKPTMFLTVHSGTKGMYMPWAYDMEHLAKRNEATMMQILTDLDKDHCHCPFGAAGREVGYPCPGTCLDWVYDKLETPYSFAFEIYTSPSENAELSERWSEKMKGDGEFVQMTSNLAHKHFHDVFERHPSNFVQLKSQQHHKRAHSDGMTNDQCFSQFNPPDEEEFNSVVDNWTRAYFDLAQYVAKDLANATISVA